MSTQQQPRPWFRLATIIRPAAPPPAPQPPAQAPQPPPPPISPFRPPVALARPPPPPPPPPAATTAPPSPVAPSAPFNLPIVSPSSVTPTAPRSPQITSTGAPAPAAVSTVASPTTKSSAATNANGVVVPPPPPAVATPALAPPALPAAIPKPDSPIIKSTSSSPPPSPGQKASAETSSATRSVGSSSSLPPSPKTKLVSSAPSSQTLPPSPAPKTLIYSDAPNAVRAHAASPVPPPPSPVTSVRAHAASPVPPPPSPVTSVRAHAASPVPPPPSPVTSVRAHAASLSPISSSKTVKTTWEGTPSPAQLTVVKPNLSRPPSPLTLPPPQLSHDYLEPIPPEAEQKTVLMQDTNHEKPPKINLKKSSGGHLMQSNHENGERKLKNKINSSDASPEFGMRVVTLAGENKGAVMELSPAASRNKYDFGKNFWTNGQKLGSNKDEARYDHQMNTDKDENDHHQYHDKGTSKMKPQAPMDAFVNSNVQGVNSSILYNCTYKNRDPDVHLYVSRKGNGVLHGLHLQQDTGHHD